MDICNCEQALTLKEEIKILKDNSVRDLESKLTYTQVLIVRCLRINGVSLKVIAEIFGVNYSTIYEITTGVHHVDNGVRLRRR